MIIAAKTNKEIDEVKMALKSAFKMKELGEAKFILGMEFNHDRTTGTLMIKQTRYIDDVANRFNQQDAKAVVNPCESGMKLTKFQSPTTNAEREEMRTKPYRSLIGCLLYITTCHEQVGATVIWEDNQGAIGLASNAGYNARTKHVDIRHHFFRENVASAIIIVKYVSTTDQLADMLTKALGSKRLNTCSKDSTPGKYIVSKRVQHQSPSLVSMISSEYVDLPQSTIRLGSITKSYAERNFSSLIANRVALRLVQSSPWRMRECSGRAKTTNSIEFTFRSTSFYSHRLQASFAYSQLVMSPIYADTVKLVEDNYFHWKFNMRMKLSPKGLLAHIIKPEFDAVSDRSAPQWKTDDLKALGVIAGDASFTYQVYIRGATSAAESWRAI
ncbi:unnamed protein product [Phytophthora lilii]|uniref:Unnamed protein product n=1 Tax=Phytophthora lilii TaxID=2077276 RepID=A0A9W6TZB8_9STRA|nr:unnamed protein product [Phytophthora lilii]